MEWVGLKVQIVYTQQFSGHFRLLYQQVLPFFLYSKLYSSKFFSTISIAINPNEISHIFFILKATLNMEL